jgi:predicted O-methyltransferase YrrM
MTYAEVVEATPWIPAWHETGACMDRRHILWLYRILKATGVQRTLEIGVHSGASSSAFVEAGVSDAHFCDITRRVDAMSVIQGKGTFHQRKGCDVIMDEPVFDLVFVDGNHSADAVAEEIFELSLGKPDILVAHDVFSTDAGYPHCEGAANLREWAKANYTFVHFDAYERQGEATQRGMMVATSIPVIAEAIIEAHSDIL